MSGDSLLEVSELRVRFAVGGAFTEAVAGLSYRLAAGRTLAIVGESGSGKTASCRALMGLLPSTATIGGSAKLNGRELLGLDEASMRKRRGAELSMVFQDPARSLNPTMRIGHQITEALRRHERLRSDAAEARAVELLRNLRVEDPQRRFAAYPHELSGGMRQRVMIAIALAGNPRLLIADEATRSLDVVTQAGTLRLLKDLQERYGMALIMVSHDLRLALSFADEVLVMYAGRAVELASARVLARTRRAPYTKALLDAIPSAEALDRRRLALVPGHPPDPRSPPRGCAFEPRCPSAGAVCGQVRPPYQEHERGHWCACWNPCAAVESRL